jgi:hypothetical protein
VKEMDECLVVTLGIFFNSVEKYWEPIVLRIQTAKTYKKAERLEYEEKVLEVMSFYYEKNANKSTVPAELRPYVTFGKEDPILYPRAIDAAPTQVIPPLIINKLFLNIFKDKETGLLKRNIIIRRRLV